ncbi:glycosyltransferase family 2 protein [Sphingomonas montanisoli]|nr:glycosyltransferase family 2 protein [Sphingomonas montanisoli]
MGDGKGVTVITVALNAARDLPLTIESVLAQDHEDIQYVVLDGCSWDGTSDVLNRYRDLIDVVAIEPDAGIYSAMNKAAYLAGRDYVMFLNAGDQFYRHDAVSRMMLAARLTSDIVYGNHVYVSGNLELFNKSKPFEIIADDLARGNIARHWHPFIPGHQATFTRTSLLRSLPYDTALQICADHDFLFRAFEAGALMQYVDETVAHYHGGGFSARRGELCRTEWADVYRRYTDYPEAVDRLLFPEKGFRSLQTRRTGVFVSGFHPEMPASHPDMADNVRWLVGNGGTLLAPPLETDGLEISGSNDFDNQLVQFLHDDQPLAVQEIPKGVFTVEVAFDTPLKPDSFLTLLPTVFDRVDGVPGSDVALAIGRFRFIHSGQARVPTLRAGTKIRFDEAHAADFADLLGLGWSHPEPNHTWSTGPRSDLRMRIADNIDAIVIKVSHNPHVQNGPQRLGVLLNGTAIIQAELPPTGHAELRIERSSDAWQAGQINTLTFKPSEVASPPDDPRLLGICLSAISFEPC